MLKYTRLSAGFRRSDQNGWVHTHTRLNAGLRIHRRILMSTMSYSWSDPRCLLDTLGEGCRYACIYVFLTWKQIHTRYTARYTDQRSHSGFGMGFGGFVCVFHTFIHRRGVVGAVVGVAAAAGGIPALDATGTPSPQPLAMPPLDRPRVFWIGAS